MFPFFQSLGTSPDCHDFSNIMESGLATTSASSLRTLGCIASGPMDFCTFRFCRRSRTWSSLTAGGILPSWSPSCHLSTREGWGERLPVKTEAKKVVEYLSFLLICCCQFADLAHERGHAFFDHLFSGWHTCKIPSCYFLHSLPSSAPAPAVPWPSWPHPYTTGQLLYTLPRKPVPASWCFTHQIKFSEVLPQKYFTTKLVH